MRFIKQDRPLVFFDIESTGLNPRADRIIELAAIRIPVKGEYKRKTWLINPGIPIPLETIAIHGITDGEVAGCPKFGDVAQEIFDFFRYADLGGFGICRFDVPILDEEFHRAGINFDADRRRQFDAQRIFHKREPRDLSAALNFYCGESLDYAHGAAFDTEASLKVLQGEFAKYEDLPTDPDELDKMINDHDPFNADREGKLRWVDSEITINFGKKKGEKLRTLVVDDPNFLKWIIKNDFARDTKDIVQNALNGKWPTPPPAAPPSCTAEMPPNNPFT